MQVPLISQINADGDLLETWFRHYLALGVTSFHVVVHGSKAENRRLYELASRYPVRIEDQYEGVFDVRDKKERLDRILARIGPAWVIVADSDEFLELPYRDIPRTVRMLRLAGADVLQAPMLQHLAAEGTLETPEVIEDPFALQPLCSVDLYALMGSSAAIRKFPLFHCDRGTRLFDGGNHNHPVGCVAESSHFRGVTHHFKFRRHVRERLTRRMNSAHPFRGESADMHGYLEQHDMRLPLEGAFPYSRRELFRRGLLVRPGVGVLTRRVAKALGGKSSGG